MQGKSFILLVLFFLSLCFQPEAQLKELTFRQVTASQGLADGVIRAIGQDKYGYIWMGTLSALNRFNGYSIQSFFNDAKDSTSLPPHTVRSILCDKLGNLWIGYNRGLCRFDYSTSKFLQVESFKNIGVMKMIQSATGEIYLVTNKGLALFDPIRRTAAFYAEQVQHPNARLLRLFPNDAFLKNNNFYIATDTGLVVFNTVSKQIELRSCDMIKGRAISKVAVDGNNNLWLSHSSNPTILIRTDTLLKKLDAYDQFGYTWVGSRGGTVTDFLIDKNGSFWLSTAGRGMARYDERNKQFIEYKNDVLRPTSLLSNHITTLFQSRDGFIWMGTEGHGINYFHPEANLFNTLLPPNKAMETMSSLWSRSIQIDKNNNYWLGMAEGLLKMDPVSGRYVRYRNTKDQIQLHSISVRSLLYDSKDRLWIGTADGVNRLTNSNGKIEFLDEQDSLPRSFYWWIMEDSRNTIWFAGRNNIFYLEPGSKQVHSLAMHEDLKQFNNTGARIIFEDSKHRLWFGLNGDGLIMYDPSSRRVKHWIRRPESDTTIINNTISAIAEDKNGILWLSSFTGITSYDPVADKFTWFTEKNGLPSIKTSSLLVDNKNRLWIGSTKGLLLMDSTRHNVKTFDLQDGLPTMEFSDMPAYKAPDARFIFPTMKGFIVFNPIDYVQQHKPVETYISSITLLGEKYRQEINAEELTSLQLRYFQNFFSFELASFNYYNPEQTWYAYKLDRFDKDWVYTKERIVNYTNVPGGHYTFFYKASSDPNNWNVPVKQLTLSIGTVFYEQFFFWLFIFLIAVCGLYFIYRRRLGQQRQIFDLQTKAQSLEKEKASAMYESLKQQLNPHFLFNSLTSLNSLIKADQKLAGEFLEGMSKMYRYILKSRDNEVVGLGEELSFVEHYIRLQKTRFETGFEVVIDVDEKYYDRKIAPVTLQNLIENAIKHNIIDDEEPLVVNIYTEGTDLVVRNNLQRKTYVETSNKHGLVQLKSLYWYLTGKYIQVSEHNGYFTIKIPLI